VSGTDHCLTVPKEKEKGGQIVIKFRCKGKGKDVFIHKEKKKRKMGPKKKKRGEFGGTGNRLVYIARLFEEKKRKGGETETMSLSFKDERKEEEKKRDAERSNLV